MGKTKRIWHKFIILLFCFPDPPYRDCTIENISDVSHDTKLLVLTLPPGCRMCVPVGYHVHIRHGIEGRNFRPISNKREHLKIRRIYNGFKLRHGNLRLLFRSLVSALHEI